MSVRRVPGASPTRGRPDLIAELNAGGDFALVRAESSAGLAWTHSHPCPIVIDDPIDYDVIVETYELEHAEQAGLVLWRVYPGCN